MPLANQRGSVMIPTLIGFFIVAILAASLIDTMNLNLREAGNAREIVNVAEAVRAVMNVLRDPAICTANLGGKSSSGENVASIKSNSVGVDRIMVRLGDLIPARTMQLKALRLHDFRAYTNGPGGLSPRGTMELDFLYEPPTGGLSRRRSVLVSTDLDAAGNIASCVALGNAADYWKLTPASDIWYGAPVAIGDVAVPADYQLYIAGYVQSDDYYHLSDARSKSAVRLLRDHASLAAIDGVRFDWRRTGEPSMGVVAQQVERVYPEAVSRGSAGEMKAVEYNQLIAPLIERVKSLDDENRALARRLARLKKRRPSASSKRF